MRILILGGAGFIGTNLAISLLNDPSNSITVVDKKRDFFIESIRSNKSIKIIESNLDCSMNFDIVSGYDVVYHLVSSNIPSTSNEHIKNDIQNNVVFSINLFDSCVKNHVKRVIFISSGGAVYGKEIGCPLNETMATNPITSYGLQKITIEKLLYLYYYMYGLDYRIIRLSNPYGPYQRPNSGLGAVTTFTYKAIKHEKIFVFGDGSVVRDFIYIDDAVRAIVNIANGKCKHRVFNVGSGVGYSINNILDKIKSTLNCDINVEYKEGRKVDVPINFLDISRYEKYYGKLSVVSLEEGIKRTADFLKDEI